MTDDTTGKRQRMTQQRKAILQAFEATGRPLNINEVLDEASKYTPRLGLRTVYRNIEEMIAERLIVSVDYPGQPIRYERRRNTHAPHLVCLDCRKLFVLDQETPDIPLDSPRTFQITGAEVVAYGRCLRQPCPERDQPDQPPAEPTARTEAAS